MASQEKLKEATAKVITQLNTTIFCNRILLSQVRCLLQAFDDSQESLKETLTAFSQLATLYLSIKEVIPDNLHQKLLNVPNLMASRVAELDELSSSVSDLMKRLERFCADSLQTLPTIEVFLREFYHLLPTAS